MREIVKENGKGRNMCITEKGGIQKTMQIYDGIDRKRNRGR